MSGPNAGVARRASLWDKYTYCGASQVRVMLNYTMNVEHLDAPQALSQFVNGNGILVVARRRERDRKVARRDIKEILPDDEPMCHGRSTMISNTSYLCSMRTCRLTSASSSESGTSWATARMRRNATSKLRGSFSLSTLRVRPKTSSAPRGRSAGACRSTSALSRRYTASRTGCAYVFTGTASKTLCGQHAVRQY